MTDDKPMTAAELAADITFSATTPEVDHIRSEMVSTSVMYELVTADTPIDNRLDTAVEVIEILAETISRQSKAIERITVERTPEQLQFVRELTMTFLLFDGGPEEIQAHLTSLFADANRSPVLRASRAQLVVDALGSGSYVIQQMRHTPGFEKVDPFLRQMAMEWAMKEMEDPDAPRE